MNGLRLLAPAKLNLFLHITGRRPDGYHELQTLFQLLDWGDDLDFHPEADGRLSLASNCAFIEGPDNLILRAAELLRGRTGCRKGAAITLEKRIPLGGGLGGGSSNAATTLLALNALWDLGLSLDELAGLGLQLGADVPVFVRGRSAWAEGVGERLQPLELPERWYLVLTPECHVDTGQIFRHPQLTRNTPALKIPAFPILGGRNDCEAVATMLYPPIREALDWLAQYAEARMTGTGASLFAAFGAREEAERVLAQKPRELRGVVARGMNVSPVHQRLEATARQV